MSTVYVQAHTTGKGYAVLSSPSVGSTVINLQSLDTNVVTVPASVTITDTNQIGEYIITWVAEGSTQIRMVLGSDTIDLDVEALPTVIGGIGALNVDVELESIDVVVEVENQL